MDSEGDLTNNEGSKVIEGINSLSPLVANKVLESMTPNEIRALAPGVSVVKFSTTVIVVADVAMSASTSFKPLFAEVAKPLARISVPISNLFACAAVKAVTV